VSFNRNPVIPAEAGISLPYRRTGRRSEIPACAGLTDRVSKAAEGTAFAVELAYGALVGMRNLDEGQAHAFLYAEAPRILFPFARRVVADAVRDAGFPPLMLEPIDFNGLYIQQLQAQQQADATQGEPVGHA
jgi:preprotein translocase subunit SecB